MSSYMVYNHKTSFFDIKKAFQEQKNLACQERKDAERRDDLCMMNDWLAPRPIGPGAVVVREQPPAAYSGNPFLRNVVIPHLASVDNRAPFPSPIMLVENKELEPLLVKILKCVEATGAHKDPRAPTNAKCNPWKKAFHRVYGGGIQNKYRRPTTSDRFGGFKTSVLDVWRLLKTRPKHPCWETSTKLHKCYKAAEEKQRLEVVRELEKLRALREKASRKATKPSIKNKKKGPTKTNISIQSKQNLSKGALSTKKDEIKKLRPEKVTKTVKHKPKTAGQDQSRIVGHKQPKAVPCVVLSVPLADKLKTKTDTPCVVVSLHLQQPSPPSPVSSAPTKPPAPQPFVPYRNPGAVAAWTNSHDENDGYCSDCSTDSLVF